MADIIEELQRDLKQERIERVLFSNGKKFVALGAIILALTALYTYKKNVDIEKSELAAGKFLAAQKSGDEKDYADVLKVNHDGYSAVALLTEANVQASKDKYSKAIKLYDKVIENKKFDKAFRDIALLNKAVELIKSGDADENLILKTLSEASDKKSIFRWNALEIKANYIATKGDKKGVKEIVDEILASEEAPETLKNRTRILIEAI